MALSTSALFYRRRDAEKIVEDPVIKSVIAAMRETQHNLFETSTPHDIESREDAHAMLRAISAFEDELNKRIADHMLIEGRTTTVL